MRDLRSAVYEGSVRHRRLQPVPHDFRYRLFMMYLDLDELPEVFDGRWLWSARRFAPAWFRRRDYLGDPAQPLAASVRDRVEKETGRRPEGPIRMLTHLRYLGHCFNPVTFYYCFAPDGERVEFVLAEITNTPWKERHAYVLAGAGRHRFRKAFHVSPFLSMDYEYDWSFGTPGETLAVHMENHGPDGKHFDATLTMERRPLDGRTLARALGRFPLMTLRVVVSIYWQALRLWWKRCPFHIHPAKKARAAS